MYAAASVIDFSFFCFLYSETSVPGPPTSLRVRAFTNSIAVSWTPPVEQDIMIRGYILGYGIGIPDVYSQILDAKMRYHTIKSLSKILYAADWCCAGAVRADSVHLFVWCISNRLSVCRNFCYQSSFWIHLIKIKRLFQIFQ